MDHKTYLTNKSFCPIPWSGIMYNFDGKIKTCIRSSSVLGSITNSSIEEILNNAQSLKNKRNMLQDTPAEQCYPCYDLEVNTNSFDIISDRVYYLKELKNVDKTLYDDPNNFKLTKIDIRWSNLCNFGCIYCGPEFSSKLANELKIKQNTPTVEQINNFKNYIFSNITNLKNVYLAGGEPLLMKENIELLKELTEKNPEVHIRVNTNLSKTETEVFDLLCSFKNVHWIVSFETMEEEYEYVRYGGKWNDFLENLIRITKLNHKISFNMLYFCLNYLSLFGTVDFLLDKGYHPNSLIIGPLFSPDYLNVRHLPEHMLNSAVIQIQERLNKSPGYLYENGLQNILKYIQRPITKNIESMKTGLEALDNRRNLNSRKIFTTFYNTLEGN